MKYRGYRIEPNLTGFVIYDFYKESEELITGNGDTIEDCKNQIDELKREEINEITSKYISKVEESQQLNYNCDEVIEMLKDLDFEISNLSNK